MSVPSAGRASGESAARTFALCRAVLGEPSLQELGVREATLARPLRMPVVVSLVGALCEATGYAGGLFDSDDVGRATLAALTEQPTASPGRRAAGAMQFSPPMAKLQYFLRLATHVSTHGGPQRVGGDPRATAQAIVAEQKARSAPELMNGLLQAFDDAENKAK